MAKLKPCPQEHCGGHLIPSYDKMVCLLCGRSTNEVRPQASPTVARVGAGRLP